MKALPQGRGMESMEIVLLDIFPFRFLRLYFQVLAE